MSDPRLEELAARLAACFPDAAASNFDGGLRFDLFDAEVSVFLSRASIELHLRKVDWPGPDTPVAGTRLWRRVEAPDFPALLAHIRAARRARRRQYRRCRFCGESHPPEHRFSSDVCSSCASAHLGIVY